MIRTTIFFHEQEEKRFCLLHELFHVQVQDHHQHDQLFIVKESLHQSDVRRLSFQSGLINKPFMRSTKKDLSRPFSVVSIAFHFHVAWLWTLNLHLENNLVVNLVNAIHFYPYSNLVTIFFLFGLKFFHKIRCFFWQLEWNVRKLQRCTHVENNDSPIDITSAPSQKSSTFWKLSYTKPHTSVIIFSLMITYSTFEWSPAACQHYQLHRGQSATLIS